MTNKIYEKYKIELNAIKKYTNNDYIYKIFYDYGFTLKNKFIALDSNINIYEACFISILTNIYINNYKTKGKLNILEIGLAYGTSCLILMNQFLKYKKSKSYDIIDMNQTKQWKRLGIKNIDAFLEHVKCTNLDYKLYEDISTIILPKLRKKYDIIFIDGSHDEKIVIQDITNGDKKLVLNGLMIIDDVLHIGVKNAILQFVKNYKNYKRISIGKDEKSFIEEKILYDIKSSKKSFFNPNTMFCFMKIF
jgi:hypothetical protein